MSEQMPLNLLHSLVLSPDNFVVHSGVAELVRELTERVRPGVFMAAYVDGAQCTGKTHLAIKLAALFVERGLHPRLVEGAQFAEFLNSVVSGNLLTPTDLILVDDAHIYLSQVLPGSSGLFVGAFERLRTAGVPIIMISAKGVGELPCDEHVLSRLRPASAYTVSAPSDHDLDEVIGSMAKQRGCKLSDVKLHFLSRRVSRDIKGIDEVLGRLHLLTHNLGKSSSFQVLNDVL